MISPLRGETPGRAEGGTTHATPPANPTLLGTVFGIPDIIDTLPCEPEIRDSFTALLDALRQAGATIRPVTIQNWNPPLARRAGLLALEAEAAIRLGPLIDRGESPYSDAFDAMISFGRTAPGEKVAAAYRTIAGVRSGTMRALAEADALLLPTAPQAPFPHGEPPPVSQADFTALASLSGCPAVAFPHRFGTAKPAPSAQLVGLPFTESRLLGLARLMETLA